MLRLVVNVYRYIYGNLHYLNLIIANILGLVILIICVEKIIFFTGVSNLSFYLLLMILVGHLLISFTNLVNDYIYNLEVNYLVWFLLNYIFLNIILVLF